MNDIACLYNQNPEREWNRLAKDAYHQLEFFTFMHHLKCHLPKKGFILDAGGGPGRYTIELARMGYEVFLLDLSSGCIEIARERISHEEAGVQDRIKGLLVADITDLRCFGSAEFDAVLCLDPLSCLPKESDRKKAVAELVRVSKPEAVVALAVRGYLDALRTILRIAGNELTDGTLERLNRTGNASCGGCLHHFFRSAELRSLAESQGIRTIVMAGGEGLSSALPEATEAIATSADLWACWKDLVIATSTEPAVVDTSGHMLYIGTSKPV